MTWTEPLRRDCDYARGGSPDWFVHEQPFGTYRESRRWLAGPIAKQWSVYTLPSLDELFNRLAAEWKESTLYSSSPSDIATHPAYQRIIGLGYSAVPLIIRSLTKEPHHWFWALKAITGEDPVPEASRGNLRQMTQAWLDWAVARGLVVTR